MELDADGILLHLTGDTLRMLRAFTTARNGSIHNQADSVIRAGIDVKLAGAPQAFRDAYALALSGGKHG